MARELETQIGRRLASVRMQRELSQGTVARRAGIAPSYLSRIETGKVHPTFRTVQRIADALRVPLEEITAMGPAEQYRRGPCPVSSSGLCLIDLIRADAAVDPGAHDEVFTPRQVKLLRRFAAWLREVEPDRQRAMEILLEELSRGAARDRA